ncbi:ATP-binding protein [Streptomyces sp. DSM 44917]|uniref:ATP-binding protein n=1 Tax=Streptomyces boetiae TaxID=3075541 RepID=A0ABU2L2Q4_9ACTN|nr:ATP-binding protein [Streptomyces sp. DSM 44917]MDT0305840.1 ATP-binding protein [Streptomyces sp. DSM 44917]
MTPFASPDPRREWFQLPALAASVATARHRVGRRLHRWGLPEAVRDTAELVISELVTNVVLHTDSRTVVCRLDGTGHRLRIEVADEGPGLPAVPARAASADARAEHGRGLMLLDALTARWGVHSPAAPGCTVWAELHPRHPA